MSGGFHITAVDSAIESKTRSLFGENDIQPWKNFRVIINSNPKAKRYILDETRAPKAKTPFWWTDYNSVKHNRTGQFHKNSINYAKANLRNLFYAFAALFILEEKLMEMNINSKEDRISTDLESKLFTNSISFYTTLLCI